jgi:hypothetical protein
MHYILAKKTLILSAVVLTTTACSIIDKADNYQLSRSNNTELVVPDGSQAARDKLVIPHENSISNITEKTEFTTPQIPESYAPLADLPVSWEDSVMWIDTPLDLETSKVVVKNFLVSVYGEGDPIEVSSDAEIVSVAMGDQDVSSLLKFYYSITRLYPDQTEYRFPLKPGPNGTQIGFQHRVVSKAQDKSVSYGDWLSPKISGAGYAFGLQFLSAISRESLSQKTSVAGVMLGAQDIWVTNDGQYVLRLDGQTQMNDIAELIEQSDLYLISRDPLELAFVTEDEVTKIGDLKPVTLPPTTEGGKETLLLNLRYRNLDGVVWQKRVYPVDLVQRTEGLFVEVDTSATEYPDVVSYRIMSALNN